MEKHPAPEIPSWILNQLPAPPERYTVRTGEYLMHVMEFGDPAGYPVLMLHGNPTWGFLYRKIVAELADMPIRIILPDIIGLGFSEKPTRHETHTLTNHCRWLGELLDQLKLEKLIFVCQDWGGAIGGGALAARPELMKGLVVLNTALSAPKEGFRPTAFHTFSRIPLVSDFVFRILGFPQNILHRTQGDPASISGNIAKAYRYPLRGLKNNLAPMAMARMVPNDLSHPSVAPLRICENYIGDFKGPAHIIWGTSDPVLKKLLNRTKRLLPHAEVTETPAGHFIQEEEPQKIAGAIKRIYQKLAE